MVKKITKFKIIEHFLADYGRRYYIRELASILKKPHQTIKPYLEALVKEGILTKNIRKNVTEYSINFKDKRMYDYLVIAEKEKLIERLQNDTYLMILFEKLSVFFRDDTFIIFGSAVDKIQEGSDIDLLVIGKQNTAMQIADFEKIYNKNVHKIQVKNLESPNLTFIKEIYKKHLIFNNTEDVIRFFGSLYEQNKLV
ncbi:MAG: nucleotidyltransferase domain-containing protein [Nanoarchaeota archaeon]